MLIVLLSFPLLAAGVVLLGCVWCGGVVVVVGWWCCSAVVAVVFGCPCSSACSAAAAAAAAWRSFVWFVGFGWGPSTGSSLALLLKRAPDSTSSQNTANTAKQHTKQAIKQTKLPHQTKAVDASSFTLPKDSTETPATQSPKRRGNGKARSLPSRRCA